MINELLELTPFPERVKNTRLPVLLYGTGDGAEKANAYLASFGIKPAGVVASDGFVRGQSFLGRRVARISEAEEEFGRFCAVICFGMGGEYGELVAALRARGHSVFAPGLPLFGEEICDAEFLRGHAAEAERVFSLLADDISRGVFKAVLAYCLTGEPDMLEVPGADSEVAGFFARGGRHIDVGAYDGDTAIEFARESGGNYTEIIAFEPDRINFRKLKSNPRLPPRVVAVNMLCGDKCGKVPFRQGEGRGSRAEDEPNGFAECVTVDAFCGFTHVDSKAPPVGSIKIDAEGMDARVLYGAANTLWCCKSNVCVAVYHRAEDLFSLPLLLHRYDPKYKLYLRKKPCLPAWDVFLYAVREDIQSGF